MAGWTVHRGLAVGLAIDNIDTDQLIPARFMATPRSQGYGRFLLHDLRHDGQGNPLPDFALNQPAARGASVLVAGRNFGAGSSRESAVYALVDAGFRAVLSSSFGDIFAANAVNNGLLPAVLPAQTVAAIQAACPAEVQIDLAGGTVAWPGGTAAFRLDPVWARKLINGWDDIDLTRAHLDAIGDYAAHRRGTAPWVWPTTRA